MSPRGLHQRAREQLRVDAVTAAREIVVAEGWPAVSMRRLAEAVGVSRQTLYNEFGDRDGVARALVAAEVERFLRGVDAALASAERPLDGLRAAFEFVLGLAAEDPLVKAVLTGRDDSLLPYLTTRAEPVLAASGVRIHGYLRAHWSRAEEADVALAADSLIRLVLSHLIMPAAPVEATARALTELAARLLPASGHHPEDHR